LVVSLAEVPLGGTFAAPAGTSLLAAPIQAIQQPLVLAPLIGAALVVAGIRFPTVADAPLALIGHATSGVAMFAVGLVLSAHGGTLEQMVLIHCCSRRPRRCGSLS
jgi:malonate transporter and related proteins